MHTKQYLFGSKDPIPIYNLTISAIDKKTGGCEKVQSLKQSVLLQDRLV